MDRRKIRELAVRYKLEPTLRDIYVEGPFDRDLVSWFLKRSGDFASKVFVVDDVDIPRSLLISSGLTDGNRQRLLVLASELADIVGIESAQVTCIVDSDFEKLLNLESEKPLVFLTDFNCMEMYLFDEVHMQKLFELVLGHKELDVEQLLNRYSCVLHELFLIRAAGVSLRIELVLPQFVRCCSHDGDCVIFNKEEYTRRMLDASNLRPQETEIKAEIARLRNGLVGDVRNFINGHDFVSFVLWDRQALLRRKGIRSIESLYAVLRASFEFESLMKQGLFRAVLSRTQRDAD